MRLSEIKGIGKKTEEALNFNNIYTINDLLYFFPKNYSIYEINYDALYSGEYTCIEGTLESSPAFIKYRKNVNAVIFYITVLGKKLKCIYFSADYLRYKLFKNVKVELYGKYKSINNEFVVKKLFFNDFVSKVDVDYKIKGVKNVIVQKAVNAIISSEISIKETLPLELIEKYKLYSIDKYLISSHFPKDKNDVKQVLRRRKYEEFFWYAIRLQLAKATRKQELKLIRQIDYHLINSFIDNLGYSLTPDQIKVIKEIEQDILAPTPMNRLVQGDVGCGKSVVAMYAALAHISAGYQAAIMVPTELLAVQQYDSCAKAFSRLGIQVELLTSSIKKSQRDDILYRLANNRVSLIIGTHALIEEKVIFNRLGIVIIDEQHKFGVNQRQRLIEKFPRIDALYLTATPIPRTLGLTAFGDLDISSINTMPEGRKITNTKIVSYLKINGLFKFLEQRIKEKEQAYVVVPLVLENEDIDAISINDATKMFSDALPFARIGVVHGKLQALEKNQVMQEFKNGLIDILISTTVIEVGVNVPKATTMVILDADRFGLAQIHQLRGRVGRSDLQAYCALVTKYTENERLKVIESTTDGFEIAEEDFKLRGPGDYLGNDQSGYASLDYADFQNDVKIWNCAKADAIEYLPKFMLEEIKNHVFNGIILENKKQKNKIN